MRRLKKNIYLGACASVLAVLAVVRVLNPSVTSPASPSALPQEGETEEVQTPLLEEEKDSLLKITSESSENSETSESSETSEPSTVAISASSLPGRAGGEAVGRSYHPIRSVRSYVAAFPDVQDTQIVAARRWGVPPVRNREMAEQRKDELVYIGASPYFVVDRGMTSSIPYLVPRASALLQRIGRNFMDSLYVKGVPMHKIIVSSALRTDEDVERLRRRNPNATEQSCHRYGTTVDICYNRYFTVSPPDDPQRRTVRDDTLKWVLSEVLRDVRQEGACYIKYEVKQGCFHLTVR